MSYTLEQFSADCRAALQKDSGPDGLEAVRLCVAKACVDSDFIAAHFGPDNNDPRKLLFEDPELKFCIFTHVHDGAKTSPPHDHGPAWAIYGQAAGTTEMTDWRCLERPTGDAPGVVETVKTYALKPGMAYVYQIGDLHSPHREGATKLIRIEGMNMDGVKRDAFMVAAA
jgi:predicted metal-dependent enzyme (double-stranded beta helix superfamily)